MKLEEIVVCLDLAKKLKENSYPQESVFYWVNIGFMGDEWQLLLERDMPDGFSDSAYYSAPTSAEIGEKLPRYDYYYCYSFRGNNGSESASCVYEFVQDHTVKHQTWADTEVNAKAKMYLYLKEKGLL